MLYGFDVCWMRRTTTRELLLHVLKESASINHCGIDNADEISLFVFQHIDVCSAYETPYRGMFTTARCNTSKPIILLKICVSLLMMSK